MPLEYSANSHEIIRGSRWPEPDDCIGLTITKSTGWPGGAAGWTWQLLISSSEAGGTPDLVLTATAAVVLGNVLTLSFSATVAQTASLPLARKYKVDIKSTNGAVITYWDAAQGYVSVRNAAGEG